MKIILIDDSRSDRDALRLMLNAIPGTEVIGEAGDFHADRRRLRDWQMILAPLGFERLDRSHLLRTDRIDSLRPYGSGCLLKMQYCQSDLELGPTALERLRELGYQ